MNISLNGKIYILISDPFNKAYIEQVLGEIPYDKRYDHKNQRTCYRLKHTRKDGPGFMKRMAEFLRENGQRMYYVQKKNSKRKENLFLYDAMTSHRERTDEDMF